MGEAGSDSARRHAIDATAGLLTPYLSARIEDALRKVGDFGEVRLVVTKGRLRFIQIMQSEDVQDIVRLD